MGETGKVLAALVATAALAPLALLFYRIANPIPISGTTYQSPSGQNSQTAVVDSTSRSIAGAIFPAQAKAGSGQIIGPFPDKTSAGLWAAQSLIFPFIAFSIGSAPSGWYIFT